MKGKAAAGLMRAIVGGAGLAMAVFSMGIDAQPQPPPQEFTVIPYIPRSDQPNEVFVHIGNDRDLSEAFTIDLFDREGRYVAAAVIYLPSRTRRWVTSRDLEHGSPEKVVHVDNFVPAVGDDLWGRVTPTPSTLDIYLRSKSRGFITEMGQGARSGETLQFFNPASNTVNRSILRIVNTSPILRRTLRIRGTDDFWENGFVMGCRIPPLGIITFDAVDLENDPTAVAGCYNAWGNGTGKWTVTVTVTSPDDGNPDGDPIVAMSLLNREGVISNTSSVRPPPP